MMGDKVLHTLEVVCAIRSYLYLTDFHQASVAQVCKVASWALVHTFIKFYQVDIHVTKNAYLVWRDLQVTA